MSDWLDAYQRLPEDAQARVKSWLLLQKLIAQTLEIFRLAEGDWLLAGVHVADAKVCAEPFDAVELDLTLIWGPPRAQDDEPE